MVALDSGLTSLGSTLSGVIALCSWADTWALANEMFGKGGWVDESGGRGGCFKNRR